MNKGLLLFISGLVLGIFVTYISINWFFFSVSLEFKVVDVFLSISSLVLGLYIASLLVPRQGRNQIRSSYLTSELTSLWSKSNELCSMLNGQATLSIRKLLVSTKSLYTGVHRLRLVLTGFNVPIEDLLAIEAQIDYLEKQVLQFEIKDNVILLKKTSDIASASAEISLKFGQLFDTINKV